MTLIHPNVNVDIYLAMGTHWPAYTLVDAQHCHHTGRMAWMAANMANESLAVASDSTHPVLRARCLAWLNDYHSQHACCCHFRCTHTESFHLTPSSGCYRTNDRRSDSVSDHFCSSVVSMHSMNTNCRSVNLVCCLLSSYPFDSCWNLDSDDDFDWQSGLGKSLHGNVVVPKRSTD